MQFDLGPITFGQRRFFWATPAFDLSFDRNCIRNPIKVF
jgi:hypothetical protein